MTEIKTYVIVDLETNSIEIRDLCLVAVSIKDIKNATSKKLPSVMSKLIFKISKKKPSDKVQKYLTFTEIFNTIQAFINCLEKPVCLVAHNGKCVDYKVLHKKCEDGSVSLPVDLLYVDSLHILRKIFNNDDLNEAGKSISSHKSSADTSLGYTVDNLSSSFAGLSTSCPNTDVCNVTMPKVYKTIFGTMGNKKYTAVEDACLKMMHCIVNQKKIFLPFSAKNCKLLSECSTSKNENTIKLEIKTYVVIKLMKTTRRKEKKIREMCLLAVSLNDLQKTTPKKLPSMMSRLSFINTEKNTSEKIQNVPIFKDIFNTVNTFIKDFEKPVCLVACSGDRTDYRMFSAEAAAASISLPTDLLCVDAQPFLKEIAKIAGIKDNKKVIEKKTSGGATMDDSSSSTESSDSETAGAAALKKKTKQNCKLTNIYQKLCEEGNDGKSKVLHYTAHNAEDDCLMLLHCIIEKRNAFLPLSEEMRKYFSELKK